MEDMAKFHTVRGYELLQQNKKLLTSAMEDYLEMIYRNSLIEGYMRINTLSELLNVQAPSATKMVQKLARLGLLKYEKYGIIFLTENGSEIGKYLLQRHNIIEAFLRNLGVEENLLLETELVEHILLADTIHRIEMFNRFVEQRPEWIKQFERYFSEYANA